MTTPITDDIRPIQMPKEPMVKEIADMPVKTTEKKSKRILSYVLVIILGIGSGYVLYNLINSGSLTGPRQVTVVKDEKSEGVTDASTFKDQAEGIVEAGGIDDEGTHKLLREGGPSQTVALVSSILDLDDYVGKKVKIWGQTFPPQKAGWFMDVGKIELLE